NSSYLFWKRLIQIRDIISMMITNLTLDNDLQTRRDVLRPFAEVTELLEDSKYAMISFMYSAITIIKQRLFLANRTLDIDFDSSDDVFENDVIYEDDESVLYEAMVYYWNMPNDEAMLATLLDPRCKPLFF
ncbi:18883_t:CDS:2, partial [Racocetra persica]